MQKNNKIMTPYTIEEVATRLQRKEYLNLPKRIYRNNRAWVHPLDTDMEAPFDPERNELISNGEITRWIARDARRQVVGRIAAFYNHDMAATYEQPTGGVGYFEAIDSQEVANLLFDTAREWLAARKMEAMDGPIHFGDRDSWWGLLVEGYELQPLYANNYNPPYYKALFENYGFQNYFDQHTYSRNVKAGVFNQSVYERVKRLSETPGYRFEHIEKGNLEQVAEDFRLIYNKAWALFTGVKPMDRAHAQKLMQNLKPIIDAKLIYFAFFNDEPIGFFIMVPDLNRVIGRFKGKMNLLNKIRLMLMLNYTHKANRIFAILFGIVPECHGKGIESGIMHAFEKTVATGKLKYKSLELAWIGDFNPVMMRMVESYVCATRFKRHTTYRYLFDRNKAFTRAPRLGVRRTQSS